MKKIFWLLGTLMGLMACSTSDHAGTNTSETQNALQLSLRMSDGSPAVGARVVVSVVKNWVDDIQDGQLQQAEEWIADDEGKVEIPLDTASEMALWVESGSEGVFRKVNHGEKDSVWQLGAMVRRQGVVASTMGTSFAGRTLYLQGTDQFSVIDSLGHYEFSALPPGEYIPVFSDSWQAMGDVEVLVTDSSSATQVDSILVTTESLLLEDFDDGDKFGNLHGWTGFADWWSFRADTAITLDPASGGVFPGALFAEVDGGHRGLSLRVRTTFTADASDSVAMVGLNLGAGSTTPQTQFSWADLHGMESLRFFAKGSGTILVMPKTQVVDDLGDDQHFHVAIKLTPNWVEYVIPVDSFIPFNPSAALSAGVSFSVAATRVSAILFQTDKAGEFWIDEVSLEGLSDLRFVSTSP